MKRRKLREVESFFREQLPFSLELPWDLQLVLMAAALVLKFIHLGGILKKLRGENNSNILQ